MIRTIDLEFMGFSELIAAFLAPCPKGGFVLLETGPASTLEALEGGIQAAGFDIGELRAVFLTHVHLDHAAASGTLARRTGAKVFAHPKGATHLADPGRKLLPSAERLYGAMMQTLWGTIEAVPVDQVEAVSDGDVVTVAGLDVTAHFTPGHAVHHIAWQVGDAIATGDVGGVRFPGASHVLPPMPPPDIDVALWKRSIDTLRRLEPETLLLTHFGAFDDAPRHLDELDARLERWLGIAERVVAEGGDPATMATELTTFDEAEMIASAVQPPAVERYRRLCPMDGNSAGLFRYCTRG